MNTRSKFQSERAPLDRDLKSGLMQRILIWDVPTRLFHWTLAVSFALAWLTTESDQWLSVHVFLGYLMIALIGFRAVWGLVGTHYARFSSFWFGPRAAWAYLRTVFIGNAERHVGHNPTGSLAIYLLLLLTLVVGVSGYFTLGGEEQQGVVSTWISLGQGRTLKKLHELSAWVMLLMVIGHVIGVVVESLLHHENLAHAMLTGSKLADVGAPLAHPRWGVAALLLVLMLGFGGWWFFYALHPELEKKLGFPESSTEAAEEPRVKFVGSKLADNAQWREECGSCHVAFHPNLLPSRSWSALMAGQAAHFGSDLALDPAVRAAVQDFLTRNSADRHPTEAAFKIDRSVPPEVTPLRVTETPYWIKKHRNIAATIWQSPQVKSRSNCTACHLDAEAGTFLDAAMSIPRRGTSVPGPAKPEP